MEKQAAKKSATTKTTKSAAKKGAQSKVVKAVKTVKPLTRATRQKKIQPSAAPSEAIVAAPMVLHACIFPNPKQPRKTFEPGHIEDLARSIYQGGGLLQPVKLTPRESDIAWKSHMIVVGECRWRAYSMLLSVFADRDEARAAALGITPNVTWFPTDVPATMESVWSVGLERFSRMAATTSAMTNDEVQDAAIIENLQRRNVSPLEEARAFQERIDALAILHSEETPELLVERLALRLGIKQSWRITERTALLRLTEELQDAFTKSLISATQAYELSRLPHGHQRHIFEAIRDGHCRTSHEIRECAQMLVDAESKPLPMFSAPSQDGISPAPIVVDQTTQPAAKPAVTAEDKQRVSKLEARIDSTLAILAAGFDGNDVIIVSKVLPGQASMIADKISIIRGHLSQLEAALRTAASIEHVQAKLVADVIANSPVELSA